MAYVQDADLAAFIRAHKHYSRDRMNARAAAKEAAEKAATLARIAHALHLIETTTPEQAEQARQLWELNGGRF